MNLPGEPRTRDHRYQPGQVIGGKYALVRRLGVGGMGTVWVAHQTVLDVHVAVKVLSLGDEAPDVGAESRMLEEARTAARIGHAAIVRVLDFGRTGQGDPFIVLELLDGEDLADVLARERKLDKFEAVATLLPIAHALAAAHDHGVVHRDVKPENIFLARSEVGVQPKLLDFGVARFVDRPKKLTLEGVVLGTPEYVSPQQAMGKPVSASADLWSFCVVLYELLTGSCPFRRKNHHALMRAIVEDEPPSILERGVDDPELWTIVCQGLSKEPEQRQGSMRQLGQQLARWMLDHGMSEDLTGASIRRTWLRDEEGSASVRGAIPPAARDANATPARVEGAGQGPPSSGTLQARALGRASRRRNIAVLCALVGAILLALLAILWGAGLLGDLGRLGVLFTAEQTRPS
jgi:eukaryotic-like serine/threonine-protein kinase